MSLTTPCRVQKLQTALHAKAKESPNLRFHALYDKVYRRDVLAHAYERCQANGGAAGGDKQTFENIEAYGRERWLDELTQGLKSRTYQPQPVRRVYIPKPDGKQRPLGSLSSMLHGCSGVTGSRRLCLERTRIWSQSKKSQTGKPRLACISSYSEAGASGRLHAQRTQGRRLFSAGECANNAA